MAPDVGTTRFPRLDLIVESGVPLAPPLRGEVEKVPCWCQEVNAALVDVVGHARMRTVEVAGRPGSIEREHRDGRVLLPLSVLAPQVEFERVVGTTQQAQMIPTPNTRMRTQ